MLRRLFLILVVLASLAIIAITVWQSGTSTQTQISSLALISDDAVVILEVNDARRFSEKMKTGSVLWPDLVELSLAASLDNYLQDIDSLFASSYRSAPDSARTYAFSLHPSGQEKFSWLLTLPGLSLSSERRGVLTKLGYQSEAGKMYDGHQIHQLKNQNIETYVFADERGIYLSQDLMCIEQHIRMNENHILKNLSFQKSNKTKGQQRSAHLHIDWSAFPNALQNSFPGARDAHTRQGFAGWSTSDLLSDVNSIYANGLVQSNDSAGHFLNRFSKQGSGSFEDFLAVIPSNAMSFSYQHISNPVLFSGFSSSSTDSIMDALGQGMLSFTLEGEKGISQEFVVFPIKDTELSEIWLDRKSKSQTIVLSEQCWAGLKCAELALVYETPLLDDSTLNALILDDYLIFGSGDGWLKKNVKHFKSNQTLSYDEDFDLLKDDIDFDASLFYYFNLARGASMVREKCSSDFSEALISEPEKFEKFQAFILQYQAADDGQFFQNVLLRHNPLKKKKRFSIWEKQLDADIVSSQLMKNHYSNQYDILIEDQNLHLKLLDNTGKELWDYELNEPLMSPVTQVDLYKNGKLQMVFNTQTKLVVLDRKGRIVEGFPVHLSDSASSQVAVMDYDLNKNYRFLIGTKDGKLHNYDRDGKAVNGWKHKEDSEAIVGEIIRFTIGKKDYITTIGENGSVRFVERNGTRRKGAKGFTLPSYDREDYQIYPGKKLQSTRFVYSNAQGELMSVQVDGPSSVLSESGQQSSEMKGQFWTNEEGILSVKNSKGEEKYRLNHSLTDSRIDLISTNYRGISDHESGMYYLYDSKGIQVSGFPVPGIHAQLKDLNLDGTLDVLILDVDAELTLYSIN